MDFPGSITIEAQTFISYVKDVCKSLVHHGFKRILVVNAHGSNEHLLDSVVRLMNIETEGQVLCVAIGLIASARFAEMAGQILEQPAGMGGHADELETSMYLAIKPELVEMSKAVKELKSPRLFLASAAVPGAHLWPSYYWSTHTQSGIMGDATLATKEKGEKLLEAAVAGLADVVKELKKKDIPERVDHH
jgi:creatinine amidohydrolase